MMNKITDPVALFLSLIWWVLCVGCASTHKSKDLLEAPSSGLASKTAYEGHWEIAKCLQGGRQAQRLRVEVEGDKVILSRWAWRKDTEPQFTATIRPDQQTHAEFISKDMISGNPVINKTHWSWMNQRIVGSIQWLPAPGDTRGNWSAVALGHFHVEKQNPKKMVWTRWGTTHSARSGKQEWTSKCEYRKVPTDSHEGTVDYSKAQFLQRIS